VDSLKIGGRKNRDRQKWLSENVGKKHGRRKRYVKKKSHYL